MKRIAKVATAGICGAALLFGIELGGYADFLLRAAPGSPAAGKARLYIDSASLILTCLLSNGDSCIPAVTAAPFPNYLRVGSALITDFGNSSTPASTRWPGGSSDNGCGSNVSTDFWPAAGYIRRATATTSGANSAGLLVRAGYQPDCITGFGGGFQFGAFIPDGAAAGSFVDQSTQAAHLMQGGILGFVFLKQNQSQTAAQMASIAAEFVADTGYITVFPAGGGTAGTSSATRYFGPYGIAGQATELTASIPMPIAGTASALWWCPAAAAIANTATMTLRKNAADTTVTVTAPAPGGAVIECMVDVTHTASYVAGDYLDFAVVTGAGTVPTSGQWGIMYTAASGTSTVISGVIAATITTTNTFSMPGANRSSGTRANVEVGLPMSCSATKLYVTQATANGVGVTTTFTLQQNGADTALTGTVTSVSGTGSLLLDGTHTVSFARGDLMQMKYVTGSGTSGTIGGWSISCN